MDQYRVPKPDGAILIYLTCVTALLGLFLGAFYALMQPTALPNAGLAQYKEPGRAAIFLGRTDTSRDGMERMESAAIAAAEEGNREQGLSPLQAYASAAPDLAVPKGPATRPETKATPKQQPKQAKPKRVVRREPVADPWRRNFAFGSNGWFGSGGSQSAWPAWR